MKGKILSKGLLIMFILAAVICIPAAADAEEQTGTQTEAPAETPSEAPTEFPGMPGMPGNSEQPQYIYEKNEQTKTCTLLRLESEAEVDSIYIPPVFEGYPVIKVESEAFSEVRGIKEVIMLGNPEFSEKEGTELFLNPTEITFYYYSGAKAEMTFRSIGGKLVPISNVTGFTAKKRSDLKSMTLAWKPYPNAVRYTILINKNKVFIPYGTASGTSLTAKNLKAGKKHEFAVYAVIRTITGKTISVKQSSAASDTLRPAGVKKLRAKALRGKIKLSWTKRKGINGYQIQRKVHVRIKMKGFKPSFSRLKTIKGAKKTSLTNVMLVSGMKYSYRIRTYKMVNKKKIYSTWKTINKKKCR